MGKSEPRSGKLADSATAVRKAPMNPLRLVASEESEPMQDRVVAVRGARRSLGRLLRALPAAGWNASAFPDVVVTQLAQYDSVTAAYLWNHEGMDIESVDEAVAGMQGIERWVRQSLDSGASNAVRCQELQVRILDEELKDPLVLSEWSGAFLKNGQEAGDEEDLRRVLEEVDPERLLVIAVRLGVALPVDWTRASRDGRERLQAEILRTLKDPALLSVLLCTLPDPARGLLSRLVGGCCDEGCLQRWAKLCSAEPSVNGADEEFGYAWSHPVQLLRDCGLVFVDPACRLAVPQGLVAPLRSVLTTLSKLDGCA